MGGRHENGEFSILWRASFFGHLRRLDKQEPESRLDMCVLCFENICLEIWEVKWWEAAGGGVLQIIGRVFDNYKEQSLKKAILVRNQKNASTSKINRNRKKRRKSSI